jgi:Mg-chelatase subunit ChlI/Mg-chelatase subunit ChlD
MVDKAQLRDARPVYPFSAVVDQQEAKTILIINAIDPTMGGALISGPKGTGKSLLVNSFSRILPDVEQVAGCPFHCSPSDPTNMCQSCRSRAVNGEALPVERTPMRVIQVPLSVTEDMLVGSIDLDKAVTMGAKALDRGLLAEANQSILYIDEVNLLPDHITDSILDAAASGWNTVEREGVSVQHPSRFILVGTMNPEEGELRPQILDRFSVFAETRSLQDPASRAQVLERNEEYSGDPYGFIERHREGLEELRRRIEDAKTLLPHVHVPDEGYPLVADTCSRLKVDGFRPDIVTVKAAKALTAFNGRDEVDRGDITTALELTLGHRTRRSGLAPPPEKREIRKALRLAERNQRLSVGMKIPEIAQILYLPARLVEGLLRMALVGMVLKALAFGVMFVSTVYLLDWVRSNVVGSSFTPTLFILEALLSLLFILVADRIMNRRRRKEEVTLGLLEQDIRLKTSGRLPESTPAKQREAGGGVQGTVSYMGEDTSGLMYGPKILGSLESMYKRAVTRGRRAGVKTKGRGSSGGRRARVVSSSSRGRYAWYQVPAGRPRDVALVPTIKAASLKQVERPRRGPMMVIEPEDVREKVREYSAPYSIVLLVDMSLSMIESVANIVETIYSLHSEVYRRRDRVGLVVFKGKRAYTLQHPTRNLDLVVKKLREVGASDFTPLAAGLFQSWKTLKQEKLRNRDAVPHLYVVSDGIVNVPLDTPLSPLTRRRYTSDAQADAFDVARLLAKEEIKVHVFNTKHSNLEGPPSLEEDKRIRLRPTQFLRELARVSKGEYVGLRLQRSEQ